jgi:hypothetical protein
MLELNGKRKFITLCYTGDGRVFTVVIHLCKVLISNFSALSVGRFTTKNRTTFTGGAVEKGN